jgi:hypothetical protein
MPAIPRTVRWTVLANLEATLVLLQQAIDQTEFSAVSMEFQEIVIKVPRSLRKRRRTTTLTGTVKSAHETTEIEWAGDEPRSKILDHLAAIEGLLPNGSLYDHGIQEALKRAGTNVVGTAEIRNLAIVLHFHETVHAVGIGRLRDRAGIVALTSRQLMFLEISNSEHFIGLPINSIQALVLGKKTGETLTASLFEASEVITNMGHGEGHEIARKFREVRRDQEKASALRSLNQTIQERN